MDGQGRWLSFPDVATALGVSVRSVRRYVQEERYVARWSAGVRELWLTADGQLPSPDGQVPSRDSAAPSSDGQLHQNGQGRPSSDGQAPQVLAAAEQAAAMWQERARNLEAENGRLQEWLALPMHEEEQELRPRWWRFWQRR